MRKRALIIACDTYDDARFSPLPGAAADAEQLSAVLADPGVGDLAVEVVAGATARAIMQSIESFFRSANSDDLLLLHVSCHGRKNANGRLFFVAKDTVFDSLAATGVDSAFLREQMDQCRSRRIVVSLDCCYSGSFGKRPSRGEATVDVAEPLNGRGRVVLTSCTSLQVSYERDRRLSSRLPAEPALFTAALIRGLRDGTADRDGDGQISVHELYEYVHDEVVAAEPEQTPLLAVDRVEGQLWIARVPARTPPPPPSPPPRSASRPRSRRAYPRSRVLIAGAISVVALTSVVAAAVEWYPFGSRENCGHALGVLGPFTGPAEPAAVAVKQAVQLAVDGFNQGKATDCLTLKEFDTAQGAAGAARAAVDDKTVLGIVGPIFSDEVRDSGPLLESAGLTMITPNARTADLSARGWTTFHRALPSDTAHSAAAAAYLQSAVRATKLYVVDDGSSFGAGAADAVAAQLSKIVVGRGLTEADGEQADFNQLALQITAAKADAVYYGGYAVNAGRLRKELWQSGWRGVLVSGDGIIDEKFAESAGDKAAEGTVATCLCIPAGETSGTFAADYRARWNAEPDEYLAFAYDAAGMLVRGIAAGKTTRKEMNYEVSARRYTGVTGAYQFTTTGELADQNARVWIYQVDAGGRFVAAQRAPQA